MTSTTEIVDEGENFFDADRQFWLLTVLKSDGKDPVLVDLKNSLAKLYKTAFQRYEPKSDIVGFLSSTILFQFCIKILHQ